jgi:membrane-bound lytic murein transglycosylase D
VRQTAFAILGFLSLAPVALAQNQNAEAPFPHPASLDSAVAFWTRVYTEVDTQGGYLHDNLHLDVIYEKLEFSNNPSSRQRRRQTNRAADGYREILTTLASGKRQGLSSEEQRVLDLWPDDVTKAELAAAANRVRFQLGQADRFREGLERSGRWKPYILSVLEREGLPSELAALPHVESSFDPTAYSRVGAAGMWQFTRSTGLRYMQIDHIIDERRDPFLSTDAATRLLADNYAVIGSWPLAITAYNHGLAGMRRAADRLGTTDIGVIISDYRGRTFGFASRNFYPAFLAALEVDTNPRRYFPDLAVAEAEDLDEVTVPDFIEAPTLVAALDVSLRELKRLNPALMETVWEGDKFVPKGFRLRLSADVAARARERLAAIPQTERFAAQRPDLYHRVRSGDTLSEIAERYGVSLAALVRTNNLRSRNFIRVGQTLTLPVASTETPPTLAAAIELPPLASGEYIVRRGDSFDRISRRLDVDMTDLMAVNGLSTGDLIYPGQSLRLPGTTTVDAQEPSAAAVLVSAVTVDESEIETGVAIPEATIEIANEIETLANVTEQDEDAIEANALETSQADLAADPSDYTVASDGTIVVQALETLGHYADWLGIQTQRLRDLNGFPFRRAVIIGRRIKLDFSEVDAETFERLRMTYQKEQQEGFFTAHQIETIENHVIHSGESLWDLANRTYDVPLWLIRQYNPNLDLDRLTPGMIVKFPKLRKIADSSSGATS